MGGVVTITVISEGKTVNPAYPLLSFELKQQVNKIASAQLIYLDEDGYLGKFKISEDEIFKPGKNIKIQVRYEMTESSDYTVFEGVIIQHKIKLDKQASLLILELRHSAIKLTSSRKSMIYLDSTDREIFTQIGKNYSGIIFNAKTQDGIRHQQMVQLCCSDWDFILSRAEANGWWLLASGNTLLLIDPSQLDNPEYIFDLAAGSMIYALEMGIDIMHQRDKIQVSSWDIDEQATLTETVTAKRSGNFCPLVEGDYYQLSHPGNLGKEELRSWAQARLSKNDSSLIRGRIKIEGLPKVTPGMVIETKNLTKYFNGKHVIYSVRHTLNLEGFQTELGIGAFADNLISIHDVKAPSAGGLLPAVSGLHIGVVEDYEENKQECQLLVKVRMPLFEDKSKAIWARLASIYAGSDRGVVFRPEVGDEVVLGFFNDDPRYPVILGSMYSAKNQPPITFNKENTSKVIVTREKMQILFDEQTKGITIQTTKDNVVNLTSEGVEAEIGITIADKNNNKINLNNNGINCSSGKDIVVKAKQSIDIEGNKVEVK